MWTAPRILAVHALGLMLMAGCNLHSGLEPLPDPADVATDADGAVDVGGGDADRPDAQGPADDTGPTSDGDACVPETDATLCMMAGNDCGVFATVDACGQPRQADCGPCPGEATCGSGGTDNVCGCPCRVDGVCFPADYVNPLNPCEICDPARDAAGWSPNIGNACDDGDLCSTGEICDTSGQCGGGTTTDCGLLDGACVTGVCDPGTGQCTTAPDPAQVGSVCDTGLACATGACVDDGTCGATPDAGFCVIADTCVAEGSVNPANPCEVCDPLASPTAWSAAPAGTTCGDVFLTCITSAQCAGSTCEIMLTNDSCYIDGACHPDGTENPANDCQVCDASQSTLTWSPAAQGRQCGSQNNCGCNLGQCLRPNGTPCS